MRSIFLVLVIAWVCPLLVQGQQVVLYDATAGTLPASQGWLAFITNGGSSSQNYVSGQGVRLVTDNAAQAGYFNKNPLTNTFINGGHPVLTRSVGFSLSFDLLVTSEGHQNNNRAGFSVIALANDNRGIELGFWTNEIWAQNDAPIFTHGEGIGFNTTVKTNYLLTLLGNSYTLQAAGNPILSGALRDYSTFGIPYTNSSFLFLGDDTTSAAADVTLGTVLLTASVPEVSTWLMLVVALGGVVGVLIWRKRVAVASLSNDLPTG